MWLDCIMFMLRWYTDSYFFKVDHVSSRHILALWLSKSCHLSRTKSFDIHQCELPANIFFQNTFLNHYEYETNKIRADLLLNWCYVKIITMAYQTASNTTDVDSNEFVQFYVPIWSPFNFGKPKKQLFFHIFISQCYLY